ncbi:MAG TPA: FAD-dependent oxidoreductase [Chloroflexota bacterium]|nr:FAD-dependent oxidoreductase [Chloroflexota bacterium]
MANQKSDGTIDFLIVGAGAAGGRAAQALREEKARGRVVVVGAEQERPYQRPPLSKDFLRGETPKHDIYLHPADWTEQHDVELRTGTRAEALDVRRRAVTLADGETLRFRRLLLATGSAPRQLSIPGASLENVLVLRTVGDAERIQRAVEGKHRVVLVGGGFIGGEVAASLRQKGLEPTVVAREAVLWEHVFGPRVAAAFQRKLERGGVRVLNGDTVVRIEGQGRAERVVTERGQSLECDAVIVGIGAAPRLELVEGTSIKTGNGVLVDRFLRTSAAGIYAAGDVARFYSPLYGARLRVEHWDVAEKHGALAGRNMAREAAGRADERESFDEPPYFFSDLFDLAMEYVGSGRPTDSVVLRGDPEAGPFSAFYVRRGRLVAGVFINRNEDVDPVKALIQSRLEVDRDVRQRLSDPGTDLRELGG